MKYLLASTVLFLFIGLSTVNAQSAPDISISATPIDPQPSERVTVSVESFSIDLDQANINWQYNGKTIDGGTGRKTISVIAPATGQVGTIVVSARALDGTAASSTLVLRPASIDLLWEATDSYTPPFYKGKALPSTNSAFRISAIPGASAPKTLVYTWSRNNTILGSLSGYNKSSLSFRNSEFNPQEQIDLTATAGAFNGSAATTITPGDPSIVAYPKNEGFIDYANGSSNALATAQPGLVVHFEPFFFSVPLSIARNLLFSITENDTEVTEPGVVNDLYLSAPESGGSSVFKVTINTIAYTLQYLVRNFTITFN